MMDCWGDLIRADPYYNPHFSKERGMFDVLSSASLDVSRAPSLLHRPVPRETLVDPPPLAAPSRAVLPPCVATRTGTDKQVSEGMVPPPRMTRGRASR